MALKVLIAAACVAVLAYVGYFFWQVHAEEQAKTEAANRRYRYSQCTQAQIESAREYALFGDRALQYGYPNAERDAQDCLSPY